MTNNGTVYALLGDQSEGVIMKISRVYEGLILMELTEILMELTEKKKTCSNGEILMELIEISLYFSPHLCISMCLSNKTHKGKKQSP